LVRYFLFLSSFGIESSVPPSSISKRRETTTLFPRRVP
jgi:hypothetical protein